MRNLFKVIILISFGVLLFSCKKEDKSIIKLSQKTVEFKSQSSSITISSYGKGFYLDAILVNDKDESVRSNSSDGSLILENSWLQVITPGFAGNKLARTMIITAKSNNTKSKRESRILVHNGSEKIYIKVTQNSVQKEDEKKDKK